MIHEKKYNKIETIDKQTNKGTKKQIVFTKAFGFAFYGLFLFCKNVSVMARYSWQCCYTW